MNIHSPSQFEINSELFGAERSIVGKCLVSPESIPEAAGQIKATDFEHPFLAKCFDLLCRFEADGQKPSIEALVSVFGPDELEPGLTPRAFLDALVKASFFRSLMRIDDAVGVMREAAQRRRVSEIASTMFASSAGIKPVMEVIAEATDGLDEIAASFRQGKRLVYDAGGAADAAFAHLDGAERTAPTTGLVDLDKCLGGWPKGELSVVAGRPGMGKSAFATTALLRAGKAKHGCLFFSLEMTGKQLGARLLTDIAYTHNEPIFYQNVLKRLVSDRDRQRLVQARDFLRSLPVVIEEQRGLTISEIVARSRKVARKFEDDGGSLDVIFVDHMLLVKPSQRYSGNRVREVAEISDGLATLAKQLNCAVVALCQLNRGVEGRDVKRPTLSDLRDSGAIEEDASTVTFIYRPAYYLAQTKAQGEAEIKRQELLETQKNVLEFIVAKNRNGEVGIVDAFVEIGANAVRNKSYGG